MGASGFLNGVETKICAIRPGLQLLSTVDPLLGAIATSGRVEGRLRALSAQMGLTYPPAFADIS